MKRRRFFVAVKQKKRITFVASCKRGRHGQSLCKNGRNTASRSSPTMSSQVVDPGIVRNAVLIGKLYKGRQRTTSKTGARFGGNADH